MRHNHIMIGADIGGTHITAAPVDMQQKSILGHALLRAEVDAQASADKIIETWGNALAQAAKGTTADRFCLAIPGPCDYQKGIILMKGQGKYEQLYNHNVKELLAKRLDTRPENIYLMNDAAAFLQGEVCAGAGSGFNKAIGVTLGTGLGSCYYNEAASEDAGLWKLPFHESIAEDYLCTRWFVRRYKEHTGMEVSGVSDLLKSDKDPLVVQQLFEEFGGNLAVFLSEFLSLYSAELIIIGGNIAKAYHYFELAFSNKFRKMYPKIPVKTVQLGEKAALLGAVNYWYNQACITHVKQTLFV